MHRYSATSFGFVICLQIGYVTCILDDAKVYTNHAKKKVIDLDDVKLASQMVLDKAFTAPPPRDVNSIPVRSKNENSNRNSMSTGPSRIGSWSEHCATATDQTTLRSSITPRPILLGRRQLQTSSRRAK